MANWLIQLETTALQVHIGPDDWMSESALHSKKPWRAVLARRRWRSGYNAGGSPNFIGKLFWNLRHNKLDYNNVNYNKLGNNKFGINEQIFSDPNSNKNNYVGQRELTVFAETTAMNPQFHIQIPKSSLASPTAKCHVVVSVTQQYETNPGTVSHRYSKT